MNISQLESYIIENYNVESDFPWVKYPNYEVFRHSGSRKWFALIMEIRRGKLGLSDEGMLDILNLKCDPLLIGSLRTAPGFFPAYHMNKESWITLALDGSVPEDQIKALLDMSYELTKDKKRGKA